MLGRFAQSKVLVMSAVFLLIVFMSSDLWPRTPGPRPEERPSLRAKQEQAPQWLAKAGAKKHASKSWTAEMIAGGILVASFVGYLLLTSNSSTPNPGQGNQPVNRLGFDSLPIYQFVYEWGEGGTGPGQFNIPEDLAVDRSGNVYVLNSGNNRIQKFNSKGEFLAEWNHPNFAPYSPGSYGIAVDSSGFVYATYDDENRHGRVRKYTDNGDLIGEWGLSPFAAYPYRYGGIATSGSSAVFVVQDDPPSKFKYSPEGNLIRQFGGGQPYLPMDIAVDEGRFVYVSSRINWVVDKFTIEGQFVASWIKDENGDDLFFNPGDMAVDEHGRVLVVSSGRIRVLSSDGKLLIDFGQGGDEPGCISDISGIEVSAEGLVHVLDRGRNRVIVFSALYMTQDHQQQAISGRRTAKSSAGSDSPRRAAQGSRTRKHADK